MFITEKQNFGDSVLFLLAARTALVNIIEQSDNENKKSLMSFIRNEASDYQAMNLLLYGTLPDEKYNDVAEMLLFSEFKESILMNRDFVTEMVGDDIFENVVNEVDSLYMTASTAAPILEFTSKTDPEILFACMLSEAAGDLKALGKRGAYKFSKATIAKDAAAKKLAALQGDRTIDTAHKFSKGALSKDAAAKKVLAAKNTTMGKIKATAGPKLAAAKKYTMAKYDAAKTAAGPKLAAAKKYAGAKATAAKQYVGVKGAALKTTAAPKIAAAGKAVAKFSGTKAGLATGGAAAAALAIYAGAKIYKRFFSQAARACQDQSGANKSVCMNKYKKTAIMKQAAGIQSASRSCSKAKDPQICQAAIAKKVNALKAKAANLSV